jgi:hypothetical protein
LIAAGPRRPTPSAPYAYVATAGFLPEVGLDSLRDLPDIEKLEDSGCSAAAINRFLDEHNLQSAPFAWTTDRTKSLPPSGEGTKCRIESARRSLMSRPLGRIGPDHTLEIIDENMNRIHGVQALSPREAAIFARGVLACATAASGPSPIEAGVAQDAHFPVLTWVVGFSHSSKQPGLQLRVAPGIDLTFVLSPEVAKKLGAALITQADVIPPPGKRNGVLN